jgi:predicted transcriptional regulator
MEIEQLRSILKLLNLKEVAREAGVHPNTLYRIAAGGEARYSTVMRVMVYLKSKGLLNG